MKFILQEETTQKKFILNEAEDNSIDWAEKLKKASGTPDFIKLWNDYFEIWGPNKNEIKNIWELFKQQTDLLGFSKIRNPFIAFLEHVLTKGIKINMTNYAGIHNAYARHYIADKDLRFQNPELNLLENRDLYTKNTDEIVEYLKFYNTLKSKLNNIATNSNHTKLANKLLGTEDKLSKTKLKNFMINFLFENNEKNIELAKLKSLSKLNDDYVKYFNEVLTKEEKKKDPTVENIFIALDINSNGINKSQLDKIKQLLVYLAAKCSDKNMVKQIGIKHKYILGLAQDPEVSAEFNSNFKNIKLPTKDEEIEKLIDNIALAAGLSKKD